MDIDDYKYERRRRIYSILLLVIIVILVAAVTELLPKKIPSFHYNFGSRQPGYYQVTEFVDGDTIAVNMNGTKEKVRLIGVDTPETHDPRKPVQCFGPAASANTKKLIGTNSVRLESDPINSNRDRYGRLLRYVYLPNGTLVNAKIISDGFGFAYTFFPFEKLADFKNLQAAAQSQHKGLWSSCQIVTEPDGAIHTAAQ